MILACLAVLTDNTMNFHSIDEGFLYRTPLQGQHLAQLSCTGNHSNECLAIRVQGANLDL